MNNEGHGCSLVARSVVGDITTQQNNDIGLFRGVPIASLQSVSTDGAW